jgi:hypothetical protein
LRFPPPEKLEEFWVPRIDDIVLDISFGRIHRNEMPTLVFEPLREVSLPASPTAEARPSIIVPKIRKLQTFFESCFFVCVY